MIKQMIAVSFIAFALAANAEETVNIVRNAGGDVVMVGAYQGNKLVSQGSGVIIDRHGYIVTNVHVIDRSDALVVKRKDGKSFTHVEIIHVDKVLDLAVIKISGDEHSFAKIGEVGDVEVGQKVVVIGNPKGLENTASEGIIGGLREKENGVQLFQITAPISSGSSGGALLNLKGELIGIVSATIKDGQNLNFAIPISYVSGVLKDILENPNKYRTIDMSPRAEVRQAPAAPSVAIHDRLMAERRLAWQIDRAYEKLEALYNRLASEDEIDAQIESTLKLESDYDNLDLVELLEYRRTAGVEKTAERLLFPVNARGRSAER